ncbi:C6 zinc finger domain-containing protein [Nannizzia gypsea CBS 118893]|uniref:C6 zinc finger domain-containing protein n=1 Tax=Arthroderma gypseum (strain ATCC MYA-4604 / CBS 118893) TaxID=535722 RepID=E4V6I1_ARTGP|nr:C6 zinc finger domain-containing protein [Nannizzia gypsea CBS 118893]EFQ96697.1 C6 zinc finger domain-containing protein [Nannizzia gypsea CBS 118893]
MNVKRKVPKLMSSRCNRNLPCEQCSRSKTELCTYLTDDDSLAEGFGHSRVTSRMTPPRLPAAGSTSRSHSTAPHETSDQISILNSQDTRPAARVPTSGFALPTLSASDPISRFPTHSFPVKDSAISPDIGQTLTLDVDFYTAPKALNTGATSSSTAYDESAVVRGIFSKTRFFGQSHWMNSIYQFSQVYEVIQKFELDETSEARTVYDKCKGLARAIKAQEIAKQPPIADILDHVPPRNIAEPLVQAYLQTFESIFRILHVPSFLRDFNNHWVNPSSSGPDFIIKLLLVMSIGSIFSPDRNISASNYSSASRWIYTAQSWLNSPFEKGRINISGIQIYCLLLLARQANGVEGDLVWISAGSLLRAAMHIGLHIGPSRLAGVTFFNQEIRRRLWATVLEIVVQSSMDAGGLPLVPIQDIDYEPPSNIDDEQLEDANEDIATTHVKPLKEYTMTSVQIALMKSYPLRLEIAQYLNNFRSKPLYEKTLHLASRLSSFCRDSYILFNSFPTNMPHPTPFQVNMLDLLSYRFLLALHHPFAIKAKANPTLYFSRKVSIEVAVSLLSRSPQSSDDNYTHLKITGTGLFRDVPVIAISTICEELIHQLEEEKSSFMPVSSSFSRQDLRKIIEEYVNLLDMRIKHRETNIRGHILFSCVLEHINAIQTGLPVNQSIAAALKRSLDQCYGTLKARAKACEIDTPSDTQPDNILGMNGAHDWLFDDEMDAGTDFDPWLS